MDQIIDMAVKNNYQGIEIRTVSGTNDIPTLDEFKGNGLNETAKKLKESGLEVACIGTSVGFAAEGKEHQEKNLESAKVSMEIAKTLDCRYIRTFGGPLPVNQGVLESMKWIREGYQKLSTLSGTMDICPLLETHDDFSTSARVKEILDGISGIGVLWDVLHPLRFGEAYEDTYAALGKYIQHVHIKDSLEYSPRGTDFKLIGEGKVQIADCIALLKSGGYNAYLSFEWEKFWHPEIPEPEIAIPHYAENINKFM
jgi:sugar phosphate isomerase/epimerase